MESIQRGDESPAGLSQEDTQETPVTAAAIPPPMAPSGAAPSSGLGASPPGSSPPAPGASRRRRRRALLLAGLAVVLLAGAGVGTWLATRGGHPRRTSGVTVVTRTVQVTAGTMSVTASGSGTIQPAQIADLDFAVPGRVTAVDVAVGDMVTAGQVLATLAPTSLEAQEAAAQQALSADEAKLSADQSSGAGTSEIASDEAQVASAQSQLTTAKKSLADASLTSTITGEVSTVDLTAGEQVSGSGDGGSSSSPTHLFGPGAGTSGTSSQVTVVTPDRFIVDCTVDDTEIGELSDGDHVLVSQTGTSVTVPGTVTFVGLVPSGTGIPSYPVTVTLTGTPAGVYAGTNAHLSFVVKQLGHALEVPTPAISYRGGHAQVTVVRPGGSHQVVDVTVGTTFNGETQITKGLTSGERVLERLETFRGGKPARKHTKVTSPLGRRAVTGFVDVPAKVPGG